MRNRPPNLRDRPPPRTAPADRRQRHPAEPAAAVSLSALLLIGGLYRGRTVYQKVS